MTTISNDVRRIDNLLQGAHPVNDTNGSTFSGGLSDLDGPTTAEVLRDSDNAFDRLGGRDARAIENPTLLSQAQYGPPAPVSVVEKAVPHPLFIDDAGQSYDPSITTSDGRRWLSVEDVGHYLRNCGHSDVSTRDLIVANGPNVHTLGGQPMMEVGQPVVIAPFAANIAGVANVRVAPVVGGEVASAENVRLNAGVAPVVGGTMAGAAVYAIAPPAPGNPMLPDMERLKVFYSIPGTLFVGTLRPSDWAASGGLGSSVTIPGTSIVLFGNVRMEYDSNSGTLGRTGFSINGGYLIPLGASGVNGGVAASASVSAEIDWSLVMDAWGQRPL